MRLLDSALQYAEDVVSGKEITTWEVKHICQKCLDDYYTRQYEEDFPYYFDEKKLGVYEALLALICYPSGYNEGQPFLAHSYPFQNFFIAMVFGWRKKSAPYQFRFNNIILYIPRKNGRLCRDK